MAGSEAVGYVALTQRFINMLAFVRDTASRLSVPAFAHVQQNSERLINAIREVMQLQTLALGTLFAVFTATAHLILPHLLGQQWDISLLLMIFSIAAVRALLSALFSIQSSALLVKKQTTLILKANTIYAVLLFVLTYIGLLVSPQEYKLLVFNWADLIAILPGYWLRHFGVQRHIGRLRYGATLYWTGGMTAALLAPWLGWWLYLLAAALLVQPISLRQMHELYLSIRETRSKSSELTGENK
jgi:O-antigen/teichoic acid export membrane protein